MSAAIASPAAREREDRVLPELFRLLGPRFRDARRVQQTQARVHAVGKPELLDELRTRANQSFEIGDALGRQTAGEITLDNLVLDDEFTIHRRRRRDRRRQPKRQEPGSRQRIRYESQLPSCFEFPHIQSQSGPSRHRCAGLTRRKKARRHSGWYLPLVLQDRTRLMLRFLCPQAAAPFHIPLNGSQRTCDTVRSLSRRLGLAPPAAAQPLVSMPFPPRFDAP